MTTQAFKTLKWFSLEWCNVPEMLVLRIDKDNCESNMLADTEQQAFDWLETNGYIERIKE